ncbi:MAG: NnrU family protein [Myxococcota bacterium]
MLEPPVSTMAVLIAAFVVTHLVLASPPVRTMIVDRLGSVRHAVIVGISAWIGLGALLGYYGAHGSEGPPGFGLEGIAWVRWPALVAMVFGMVLMTAIVAPSGYLASSTVVFGRTTRPARGLEQITRHPFFVGLLLYCLGHVAVARHRIGVVLFAGFGVLALVGAILQDRKLLAARGDSHAEFLRSTSLLPFVAILRGRQRLAWGELPWVFLGLGLAGAFGVRQLHGRGLDYAWLMVFGVLVVVPLWFGFKSAFAQHRGRSHARSSSSPHRDDRP